MCHTEGMREGQRQNKNTSYMPLCMPASLSCYLCACLPETCVPACLNRCLLSACRPFLFSFLFFFFNFQRTVVLYVLHRKHYFPSSHPSLFDLGVHCPVNRTWSPQDNLHTSTSPPTKRPTLLGNPPGTECFKAASIVFQPSLTVQSMGISWWLISPLPAEDCCCHYMDS